MPSFNVQRFNREPPRADKIFQVEAKSAEGAIQELPLALTSNRQDAYNYFRVWPVGRPEAEAEEFISHHDLQPR